MHWRLASRFLAAPETDAGWVYAARAMGAPPPPLHSAALGVRASEGRSAREQHAAAASHPLLSPIPWAKDSTPEPSGGAFTAAAGAHRGFVRTVGPAVRALRGSPGAVGSAAGSGLGSGSCDRAGGSGSLGACSSGSRPAVRPDLDAVGSGPGSGSGINTDPTARLADRPPPAPEPAECAVLLAGACFSWAAGDGASCAEAVQQAWEVGELGIPRAERELVLQDVSLAVRAGSFTVVVGEVGAGGCPHAVLAAMQSMRSAVCLTCATNPAWSCQVTLFRPVQGLLWYRNLIGHSLGLCW